MNRKVAAQAPRTDEQARMLENRLRKRYRHLRKWARRVGVSCYRVYDRDIPEIPLSIDLYQEYQEYREHRQHRQHRQRAQAAQRGAIAESGDRPRHLYIAHHQSDRKASTDSDWLAAMTATVARVLDIDNACIHIKQRMRQRGTAQYERMSDSEHRIVVCEGGHRFVVNLDDYLDTGLFLDHRCTRGQVQRNANGARFLNLFCYTGAFTVYAAMGGARSSVSVDLSNRYLSWTAGNLALNGIDPSVHQIERVDVFEYLRRPVREPFDLAVLDPPTFSNSKRMDGVLDIQRDHTHLIGATLRRLRPGGVLYFSTNARRFKFERDAIVASDIVDITVDTLDEDFVQRRPHQCWRIIR